MNVSLSPRFQALIREKIESGGYSDAREVLEEALNLLDNRDRLERLGQSLREADEAIDRGEGIEWGLELKERIRARARELARQGIKPNPDVWP